MTAFAALYTLHVLAALVWVGGMFFAWAVLRPAAAVLDGPARLTLWNAVFPRFFRWVWAAVLLLPLSGVGLLHLGFGGFDTAPRYVQAMMGLYVAMVSLFLRIQTLHLPGLRRAVDAADWNEGAQGLARIRRLVGLNLLLGLSVVALGAARPGF
ncbi:CopD family protein [Pseudomonas mangiferae]|uniref:Copper resistance protein D domain-containing protein n=1 Tax=Pseudomonas mangiferae TaxID=2593654 RepID=A0A553H1Z3_9PSED|nr:CopD family protein [Pseudomonas mangiferae]TRX75770.1 hypothetical protein FM069_04850 [Pseudomonas mangiferae]